MSYLKCKDAFTRVNENNEELFDLAPKTENPDAACKNRAHWLEIVTQKEGQNYHCQTRVP